MKVMVTGATGFIGSHVVELLLHHQFAVRVFCRSVPLARRMFGERVEIVSGDMQDENGAAQAVRDCDAVIHLAGYAKNWAKDPALFDRVNVAGTRYLLEAALEAGLKKVVITSTNLTIPASGGGPPADENRPPLERFSNDYQASKCRMEKMIASYVAQGCPAVMVNPTRVFGPGILSEANSVTQMIRQYLAGTWRLILGDGNARGNYGFVADVARGHLLALTEGKVGERYLLGGSNLSFNQFFAILAEVSGRQRRMFHVPDRVALGIAGAAKFFALRFGLHPLITPEWVETFLQDWEINNDKAVRDLGYSITPFPLALKKTINWLNQSEAKEGSYENDYPYPESRTVL